MANRKYPEGHKYWSSNRCDKAQIFANPEKLLDACVNYFEWNDSNPLMTTKAMTVDKTIEMVELPKARAMTIVGLTQHIGISRKTWYNYKEREEFSEVTQFVEDTIFRQKFELAAADLLNGRIIARDLGLREETINHTYVKHKELTEDEAKAINRALEDEY